MALNIFSMFDISIGCFFSGIHSSIRGINTNLLPAIPLLKNVLFFANLFLIITSIGVTLENIHKNIIKSK